MKIQELTPNTNHRPLTEDWDDWEDYGQSEYLNSLLSNIGKGDAEKVVYYYRRVLEEITESGAIRAIANYINPEKKPIVKTHLLKLLLKILKKQDDFGVVQGLIEAIRYHVDWAELDMIEKSINADSKLNEEEDDEIPYEVLVDSSLDQVVYAINNSNIQEFKEGYNALIEWLWNESDVVKAIAKRLSPEADKTKLIRFILQLIKGTIEDQFAYTDEDDNFTYASVLIDAIKLHKVNWPELIKIQKSLDSKSHNINEEKIKGADGKSCWKGYRYAGTEHGKDKCIPVKGSK